MSSVEARAKGARTLADLLPYQALDPESGILWLKDGSATQTLEVEPLNCLSFNEGELEALRSGLTQALNALPEGATAQIIWNRERSSETQDRALTAWRNPREPEATPEGANVFQAKVVQIRSQIKNRSLFQMRVWITLRLPPGGTDRPSSISLLGPLAFLRIGKSKSKNSNALSPEQSLGQALSMLKTHLENTGFHTRESSSSERLRFLTRFLNPLRPESLIAGDSDLSEKGMDLDLSERLALTDLIESRSGISLGPSRVFIGSLKSYPESSIPALMSLLCSELETFTIVQTILSISQTAERERLQRRQRLATGLAGGGGVRDLAAEAQLTEVEETLSAMIAQGDKLLVASTQLIYMERDQPETIPENHSRWIFEGLLQSASRLGAGCQWFEETVGAYPVFLGTLPFAPTFVPRPRRILSKNLSDLLPLYGAGPGHALPGVLFETPYQSLLGFSLSEKSASSNGILVGSAGSGKSTLACGLVLGMTAGNPSPLPSCFVIDVGNSFQRTLLYLGGTSIDLSPEKGCILNPFDLEQGQTRPDPEKIKFLTAVFDEILGDAGNLNKLERALLEREILLFYETNPSEADRTFSKFRDHLAETEAPELRRLSRLLTLWCRPHPYGLLFDGKTNVDLSAPHLHFELKGCQRYPDLLRITMLVVMDLIWRQIKKRFPLPSVMIVDECHTVIRPSADGKSNPGARWIDDCFRQMRKFSSAVLAISQTAKDLKNAEVGDGIIANAPNRFILRQRGDESTLRDDLKFNDRELSEVFSLRQSRGEFSEFYLHSESMRGVLIHRPTPLELWLSTTHPPDIELLETERRAHPELSLRELMAHMAERYPRGAQERAS